MSRLYNFSKPKKGLLDFYESRLHCADAKKPRNEYPKHEINKGLPQKSHFIATISDTTISRPELNDHFDCAYDYIADPLHIKGKFNWSEISDVIYGKRQVLIEVTFEKYKDAETFREFLGAHNFFRVNYNGYQDFADSSLASLLSYWFKREDRPPSHSKINAEIAQSPYL